MKRLLKNRGIKDFFNQVAFDFLTQLREVIEAEGIGRSKFAVRLGVTKGRVSQILNGPSNLTLENIVRYSLRLNRKVAVVVYKDGDPSNRKGPILPQVFVECWKRNGCPRDFFDLDKRQAPQINNVFISFSDREAKANVAPFQRPITFEPQTGTNGPMLRVVGGR